MATVNVNTDMVFTVIVYVEAVVVGSLKIESAVTGNKQFGGTIWTRQLTKDETHLLTKYVCCIMCIMNWIVNFIYIIIGSFPDVKLEEHALRLMLSSPKFY